jgi:cytochrome c oxidase assembly protein subunit 15
MSSNYLRRFILISQITLFFVFLVIIAGSVVRASGSGMGCPDWPKCFGRWIPPTDVSQLPENYKTIYAGEHNAVAEFNALNTWTEYVNRLAGAILGILIILQFIVSIPIRKADSRIFLLSLVELLLIGFQGWLGAKVVSSNLAPVKITIHMVVALVILAIAVAIIYRAKKLNGKAGEIPLSDSLKKISVIAILFTIIQIMLGTQVREEVDLLVRNFDPSLRDQIISNTSAVFLVHRSFSILILLLNGWWLFRLYKENASSTLKGYGTSLILLLVAEAGAGIILSRFALPAAVQPVHLLLGCLIFALQFIMLLRTLRKA